MGGDIIPEQSVNTERDPMLMSSVDGNTPLNSLPSQEIVHPPSKNVRKNAFVNSFYNKKKTKARNMRNIVITNS